MHQLSPQQIQAIQDGLARAQALINAGQSQPAEVICRRILADFPDEPNALHMLGLMSYNAGDPDKAISYLRQACQSPMASALYFSNLTEMLRQRGRTPAPSIPRRHWPLFALSRPKRTREQQPLWP